MKILLTGGGTGGHFYPLIAIAEKLIEQTDKQKIVDLKLYYMSDKPYDKRMLTENGINFVQVPAGKMRLYFSLKNISDFFKTLSGMFIGFFSMFFIYPDVPKEKTALTGQPIRKNILHGDSEGAYEFFKLESTLPVILVVGGSSGAEIINNIMIEVLPDLLSKYQIIHQTGINNIDDVLGRSKLVMENNANIARYVALPYLNNLATRKAAGIANIIISRAGSAIFEISSWGIPSIIIPITKSNGDHQRKNAYNYARTGACEVIDEANLTPHLLISEIDKMMNSKEKLDKMKESALAFANPLAAEKIAEEAIIIALSHEEQ